MWKDDNLNWFIFWFMKLTPNVQIQCKLTLWTPIRARRRSICACILGYIFHSAILIHEIRSLCANSATMSPTKTDRVATFFNRFSIFFFWMKENLKGYLLSKFHKNWLNNKPVVAILVEWEELGTKSKFARNLHIKSEFHESI